MFACLSGSLLKCHFLNNNAFLPWPSNLKLTTQHLQSLSPVLFVSIVIIFLHTFPYVFCLFMFSLPFSLHQNVRSTRVGLAVHCVSSDHWPVQSRQPDICLVNKCGQKKQKVPHFWFGTLELGFHWASLNLPIQWVMESQLKGVEMLHLSVPVSPIPHSPATSLGRGGPSTFQELPHWEFCPWPLHRVPENCFWIWLWKDTFGYKSPSWLK